MTTTHNSNNSSRLPHGAAASGQQQPQQQQPPPPRRRMVLFRLGIYLLLLLCLIVMAFYHSCSAAITASTTSTTSTEKQLPAEHPEACRSATMTTTNNNNNTSTTPSRLCVITALYAARVSDLDGLKPPAAEYFSPNNTNTDVDFWVFTNLADYVPPDPWQPWIVPHLAQKKFHRHVTPSRYGKFVSWKEPYIYNHCRLVVYHDGLYSLRNGSLPKLRRIADMLADSSIGWMQYPHPDRRAGIRDELATIVRVRRDTAHNTNALWNYLQRQPDFVDDVPIYTNFFFFYRPQSTVYQRVSDHFWKIYATENYSVRDQPLWAYLLWHHRVTPQHVPFRETQLIRIHYDQIGFAGHEPYKNNNNNNSNETKNNGNNNHSNTTSTT